MCRLLIIALALLAAIPLAADQPVVVSPPVVDAPLPPPVQPAPPVTPEVKTDVVAPIEFAIEGPEKIAAGDLLELKVVGVTTVTQSPNGPIPAVRVAMYPESKNSRIYNNGYVTTYCSPTPGFVWFVASCNNPDPIAPPLMAMKLVEVTGGINPAPPVPPKPPKPEPPKPDPVVVPGKRQVVVLYESSDKSPELARVLTGLRTGSSNKYLLDNGHEFYILDADEKDENGQPSVVVKKFKDMAGDTPMPALIIQDLASGDILDKKKLPATDQATIELIKGTGG